MNGFVIFFIVLYIINFIGGLIQIGMGNKPMKMKAVTHLESGIVKILGVLIGLPLFLAAVGIV